MIDLPLRAKQLVLGSVVRSALPWCLPVVGLATSPWLFTTDGTWDPSISWRTLALTIVVPTLIAVLVAVRFPHDRFGRWASRRMQRKGVAPSGRTVNLTDELAIATGTYGRYVTYLLDTPIPNVAALPAPHGADVIVTTGAEQALDRDALEALLASQIVVVSEPWVRLASAAQVVGSLRFLLMFGSTFINPLLMPFAFLAFFGHRRGDTVRDMVADATALRATRHPEALARAFYELRPAAPHASRLRLGVPAFLVDQFWVLSSRMQVSTSVSTPRSQRAWTTADEIAAEMAMRADRMRRAAHGDDDAAFDLRSWKRAVKGLGTEAMTPTGLSIPLTPAERSAADAVGAALDTTRPQGWFGRG